jgi:hypothetical protein
MPKSFQPNKKARVSCLPNQEKRRNVCLNEFVCVIVDCDNVFSTARGLSDQYRYNQRCSDCRREIDSLQDDYTKSVVSGGDSELLDFDGDKAMMSDDPNIHADSDMCHLWKTLFRQVV